MDKFEADVISLGKKEIDSILNSSFVLLPFVTDVKKRVSVKMKMFARLDNGQHESKSDNDAALSTP